MLAIRFCQVPLAVTASDMHNSFYISSLGR